MTPATAAAPAADRSTARYLGAAFLFVFVLSVITQVRIGPPAGAAEMLAGASTNATWLRVGILAELLNSLGIVALAALLYRSLHRQSATLALVALGWWWLEAMTLALSKIGTYALIPLSEAFASAGSPGPSYHHLSAFLYDGIDRQGYQIHVLFFALGAVLWYFLLHRARYVPRLLSGWGLMSVSALALYTMASLVEPSAAAPLGLLAAPYVLFEPAIGFWLVLRGAALETTPA